MPLYVLMHEELVRVKEENKKLKAKNLTLIARMSYLEWRNRKLEEDGRLDHSVGFVKLSDFKK